MSDGGGVEAVPASARRRRGGRAEAQFEVAPRGFFEVSRRNLWGKNRSLSLFTRVSFRPRDPAIDSTDPTDEGGYGFNEYRVVGTFREPRPFDRPGEAAVDRLSRTGRADELQLQPPRRSRGVCPAASDGGLTVSGRYAFDYTRLFDEQIQPEDRLLVDRLFPQVRLSTFTGSVLRDSRNDVLDPERGAVTGIDASVAPRLLGSEVGFVQDVRPGRSSTAVCPATAPIRARRCRQLGLAVGFERQVERLDAAGQPVLGPDGQPLVESSRICRRVSGSSPAAIRPCAASCSISSAPPTR